MIWRGEWILFPSHFLQPESMGAEYSSNPGLRNQEVRVIDSKGLWMIDKHYRPNYTSIFSRENSFIDLDHRRNKALEEIRPGKRKFLSELNTNSVFSLHTQHGRVSFFLPIYTSSHDEVLVDSVLCGFVQITTAESELLRQPCVISRRNHPAASRLSFPLPPCSSVLESMSILCW